MNDTIMVESDYYIAVCPVYPALLAAFPDGFPFSSAIANPVVSEDGNIAATMAAIRRDVDLKDYSMLPITFYAWTRSGLDLAKAEHPSVPWDDLPRFSGQPEPR